MLMSRGLKERGALRLSVDWHHSDVDRLERNGASVDSLVDGRNAVDVWLFGADLGLTPWLTASIAMPLSFSRAENRLPNGSTTRAEALGAGDLTFEATVSGQRRAWNGGIGVGAKMPTGESRVRDSGVLLPPALQPGAGHWQSTATAQLGYTFGSAWSTVRPGLGSLLRARWPIGGNDAYRSGAALRGAISGTIVWQRLMPELAIVFDHVEPDQLRGETIEDTGSDQLSIALSLGFMLIDPWLELHLHGQRAAWRALRGSQLVGDVTIGAGISVITKVH